MADETPPVRRSSCLAKIAALIPMLGVAGLGVAMYFISLPQDLSDLTDDLPPAGALPGRDLTVVLKNAAERGFPVTLTEEELNAWLARTLEARQGGLLEEYVTVEGVRLRLEKDHAEVIIERRIFGHPNTVSMFLRIEQTETAKSVTKQLYFDGGQFHESLPFPPRGGRFGQLTVPQGFLILVRSSFEELAALYAEELQLGPEGMARVTINEGSITLDPRDPSTEMPGLPGSF